MKRINEIMTREVESVGPDTTVREAARKMKVLALSSLPVCEGGKVLGIVTDREMTLCLASDHPDPSQGPVKEIMNPEVAVCSEDDDFEEVTRTMEGTGSHHVLAIDKRGRLAGIISLGKVARADERTAGRVVKRIS